jgi:lipid II:glycine glycyltransferase (peptidoglycan interpeptide bridge formation enzyme)
MVWKGFKDMQATIEIDLTKPIEELWNALDKDARWGAKRAKKEGLTVSFAREDEWKVFYDIYKDTCKRGMIFPLPFEKIKENTKLLLCKKDDKIIAGSIIKEHGNEKIELFLNASLPEFLKFQPNNLLYWSMIECGKQQGLKILDLGGYQLKAKSGTKLYEINRFKERWGGKIRIYPIYSKNPFYILGRKIIRNFNFIKKTRDWLRVTLRH